MTRGRKTKSEEQSSYFAKPTLDNMGPGTDMPTPLFRKNTLDEMTVGRTEKPLSGKLPEKPGDTGKRFSPLLEGQPERGEAPTSPSSSSGERSETRGPNSDPSSDSIRGPVIRGKVGVGSYEDPGEQKRKGRTKGKTGRPGR